MFPFLPAHYRNQSVVAGGYAACASLASDMDVWVLVAPHEISEVRRDILNYLRGRCYRFLEERSNVPEPDGNGRMVDPDYLQSVKFITRKVAKVLDHEPPVHIMVTTADDALQLIDSFDLSTHAVALDSFGNVIRGSRWTPLTEVPEVQHNRSPKTPERYRKLIRRYKSNV